MCGICGFAGLEDKNLIKKMCDIISHRGPDDFGYYYGDNIMLGHRRLSIIDLEGGRQPIHNEDETIWIIFNGEIYNFKELRKNLEEKGHTFYTSTDTEVIVHLYEEFGIKFVEKLNGMFAFALWDSNTSSLLLIRDRLGIKPLYYTLKDNKLLFSSEIKSLLKFEELDKRINLNLLPHYFTYRSTPSSETIFKDVLKLPPGYVLSFHVPSSEIRLYPYWEIKCRKKDYGKNFNLFLDSFKELLTGSVNKRLMSDVPLGVFLSGGVDSSTIAALAAQASEESINTFSVGFGSPSDELVYAKEIADYLGTEHHEVIVDPPKLTKLLPKIIWYLDEPIADPATIPTYLMSEATREYVKVILTGEGADELFAGYPKYKLFSSYLKFVPSSWKYKIYEYSPPSNVFNVSEKSKLFSTSQKLENRSEKPSTLNQLLVDDIEYWLPNYLLMKVDKMTMANGLEARVPFLDHRMVDFSTKLPEELKLNGFTGKYILRQLAGNLLPKEAAKRKKRGFPMPLNNLMRNGLADFMQQTLLESESLKQFFNLEQVNKIVKGVNSPIPIKNTRYTHQAWLLLYFSLWYKVFIEN